MWSNHGVGYNYKVEGWWRMCGSQICVKFQAWESGIAYYNLGQRGSNVEEFCTSELSDSQCYGQQMIADLFRHFCDRLEEDGRNLVSACQDHWYKCMSDSPDGRFSGSGYTVECHGIHTDFPWAWGGDHQRSDWWDAGKQCGLKP